MFDFTAFVRQVAAAVAANGFWFSWKLRIRLLQIGEQDFGVQAGICEDHGLQITIQEFLRHARGFIDVAAADAQSAIDDGRIVEDEGLLRRGRAVGIQDFDFRFEKAACQISGIGNRSRAANELRVAAVEARNTPETPEDVAQVAAKDATISVQLVDYDVAQIFEEARPAGVVREDPGVQHVRVGQDHVAFFANGFARVGGSVTVVSEDAEAVLQALVEIVEFGELVLREGLGGKEIEGACV